MTTGGSIETFTYDGHGRRTRSTTGSSTRVHFYTQAGQLLLSENPATPTKITKSRQYHIYLGDRRIAQQEMDGRSHIHTDHIGSLLARIDTTGSLLEGPTIWEAWGAPVNGYSSVGGLRFAGHYSDRATGLSYMRQRYYDPYAGRFLAVDPVAASPGSFNRYWYANDNPYKDSVPDGRLVWLIPMAVYAVGALLHSAPANAPAPGEEGVTEAPDEVLMAGLPPAKALVPIKFAVRSGDFTRKQKEEIKSDNAKEK